MIVEEVHDIPGVPDYTAFHCSDKAADYCVLIPVLNEGERIRAELSTMARERINEYCDIIICDGGSVDGSTSLDFLSTTPVSVLIEKNGPGQQGAQLRCGIHLAMKRSYKGVITVDGNNKDSVECIPLFIEALLDGYDFVQGSRFARLGYAEKTPFIRYLALRLVHAPVTSLAAGQLFTDTTNAFRAYSMKYLTDPRVSPLRDIFAGYELLAYLAIRATQIGYKACEVPVARRYPRRGPTPTKISPLRGNLRLLQVLFSAALGLYNPEEGDSKA